MTEEQIANECETAFQKGGPRVYTFNPSLGKLQASSYSAKRTLELAFEGMQVWSRRKVGSFYRWRVAHKV